MTRALIIGGGVAGPVAALALRKAGIDSTVYEAYPRGADDVGAFLMLFANGLAALRSADALAPVADRSFPAESVEFYSRTGERLGRRPLRGSGEGGLAPRTMTRADLHRALSDEAERQSIPVEYGKRLVDAATTASGGVAAVFDDGSRAEGDLLIGADGLHSRTRTLLDAAAPGPRHAGQSTVCGRLAHHPEAAPPGTYRMILGDRAVFGCTTAPGGPTYWFANIPGQELSRDGLAAVTPDQWRQRVADVFAGDDTAAAGIVAATGPDIVASNTYDIPSTPVWHSRSMVIIGDAAHATAPNAAQGASLAIEDAVVLAQCLRDLPDTPRAFAAYERLRRERVERIVAMSGRLAARDPQAVPERTRDARTARALDRDEGRGGSDWIRDYRIDWDEKAG
ncbi:FAD-dependent monooxygenase [Streptomyces sp. NPDC050617]|uniref:FAD-dependent monooxygenase n=1 Tax=Streptomyces sp. NPDC050617 TaxID=3154628 RepID=UPI00341E9803